MHTVPISVGPKRRIRTTYTARIVAGLLTAMLVLQLFGYESFASLLAVLMPFNDHKLTEMLAACLVFAELLALPYLLAMPLSPAMRVLSAATGAIAVTFWVFTQLVSSHAGNAAIFSDTLPLPGGLLAFLFSLMLTAGFYYVLVADLRARSS